MPSAKRPVRKSSTSGKAKPAASAKARASRPAARKAARKPAPVRRVAPKAKPAAGKSVAKPTAGNRAKAPVAAKATKPVKAPAAAPQAKTPPAKANAIKVPVVKEMIVRTPPGLVKTGGRKPPPAARKASRRIEVYDPNALIHGIRPYQAQAGEAYMSPSQLDHFRMILQAWKRELMEEVDRTVHHMQDEASNFPDPNDRATQESEFGLELRTRDRERKLLKKIDSALERIEDGSYGYCEETGEEIGLKRLEARPVATLSLEAQERREMAERQYGERDDRYR